ncbi:MAG: alpha-amylase family glycosyl hydrolase [Pseudomonadales bacterium]|jgi:maltose alpha-D-glucosyltransferase/alpha-amylase|nr:alpha-amylase family glycosyl hydrolase [Pseudomonadales bacterium]
MYPDWLASAVFYQIYPQSFADSNGDGIGDLPGIVSRLDYLFELGVNALWLNPIFDSPFLDAGYDVRDYFRVADRYGSNADLRRLCSEAHARGIRVCLDLVPGHTSADHPGFLASARPERNAWSDRFVWSDDPWITRDGDLTLISGMHDRTGAFAVNFFAHQPALNFGFAEPRRAWQQRPEAPGPQANRAMLREIMAFWFEHGVDGFRVDLAATLVKADPSQTGVRGLWRELRAWMDAEHPGKLLISEWGDPGRAISAGFHVDFMLHFGTPGYAELMFNGEGFARIRSGVPHCFFDRAGRGDFGHFQRSFDLQHELVDGAGFVGLPSANHDFQRPNAGGRKPDELLTILAFLLTWPAVPFLYYGDEIGMRYLPDLPSREGGYQRTGTRTPMQWTAEAGAGFSAAPEADIYLPLDPAPGRPDLATQRADDGSLWHAVRSLVALRRGERALSAEAPVQRLDEGPGYPLVYLRGDDAERVLVAIMAAEGEGRFELPPTVAVDEALFVAGAQVADGVLRLQGPAVGLWRVTSP